MPVAQHQLSKWKATTAAIHSPWHAEAYQDGMEPQYLKDADGDHLVSTQEDYEIDPIDLAFMAVASEAMPLLLAEVERLQSVIDSRNESLRLLGCAGVVMARHGLLNEWREVAKDGDDDTLGRDLTPEEMRAISADRRGREPWKEDS